MSPESLESVIESAWFDLQLAHKPRTIYLTPGNRLVYGRDAQALSGLREVGTYTRSVELRDFRDDVFWAYERGIRNG